MLYPLLSPHASQFASQPFQGLPSLLFPFVKYLISSLSLGMLLAPFFYSSYYLKPCSLFPFASSTHPLISTVPVSYMLSSSAAIYLIPSLYSWCSKAFWDIVDVLYQRQSSSLSFILPYFYHKQPYWNWGLLVLKRKKKKLLLISFNMAFSWELEMVPL